jgi:maltose alpha-D-glucosyltransferase/alpha-amylase
MAFHFPLMPRMFMALRQEDRHAISEILTQTPDIPDSCQWALFLRNHDELTLEMVTDDERDYMYKAYAADPQMRLNVGIRRRLAPLMENSRRRIELLNSLLFSMPGTPIVYYGDEIGMGDNIYLGDRNGVRTPMQWNGDRNGGFSKADTARLFAPPIMDPVYGYQSINVEAQQRYPFSLLNWMKRLIGMRKQHRVLGRAPLEFVGCSNRKTLAYLRRDERETILVVANLSPTVQPTELDLCACAGRVPVEMNGLTEFPRVTERGYFLTLGPYACYWFLLQGESMQVSQMAPRSSGADAAGHPIDTLPAILVGVNWEGIFDSEMRGILERQALVPFLLRQRWFGSKSRTVRQARFSDWAMLRGGSTPAFVTMASVSYADGWVETYLVPLTFVAGEQAERIRNASSASVMARVTGARNGILIDGFCDDDSCDRLLTLLSDAGELRSARGALRGQSFSTPELGPELRWTRPSGDQSNSLAFVNDRYVLKLFRRIAPGPNPELEITRVLTARGFTRAPALIGALAYERPSLEPGTLAVLQSAVQHQGSFWDFTVDELRRYYDRALARVARSPDLNPREYHESGAADPGAAAPPEQPPPFFAALEGWYLTQAEILGRRTAEFHATLAGSDDPAFIPEPLGSTALTTLSESMLQQAESILGRLEVRLDTFADPVRAQADAVVRARPAILARLGAIRNLAGAGMQIRVHGDYHLGQVLRTEEDFVLLDFEGEPARSLEERRAKQSPLKDVAGMIRSFSYAAHAALFAFALHTPDTMDQLEPWADTWEYWVSQSFIAGYRAGSGASGLTPDRVSFDLLLRAFAIEKAVYELGYEMDSRPDWIRIPLAGILKVV